MNVSTRSSKLLIFSFQGKAEKIDLKSPQKDSNEHRQRAVFVSEAQKADKWKITFCEAFSGELFSIALISRVSQAVNRVIAVRADFGDNKAISLTRYHQRTHS